MSARNWESPQLFGSGLSLVGNGFRLRNRRSSDDSRNSLSSLGTGKRSKTWYFVFWSEMAYFSNLTILGNSLENYGISILDKKYSSLGIFHYYQSLCCV